MKEHLKFKLFENKLTDCFLVEVTPLKYLQKVIGSKVGFRHKTTRDLNFVFGLICKTLKN